MPIKVSAAPALLCLAVLAAAVHACSSNDALVRCAGQVFDTMDSKFACPSCKFDGVIGRHELQRFIEARKGNLAWYERLLVPVDTAVGAVMGACDKDGSGSVARAEFMQCARESIPQIEGKYRSRACKVLECRDGGGPGRGDREL